MGLQRDLDYRVGLPNPLQRGVQAVAATKPGSWALQRTLYRLDRPLFRWTDGRVTLPGILTGLPVLMLTTTGAKSGQPRTMPVGGIPVGSDIALLGTNFAQARTPAWAVNLEAHPQARVSWRGRALDVMARPADEAEREEAWTAAARYYRGFADYRRRIEDRQVRIFVLAGAA